MSAYITDPLGVQTGLLAETAAPLPTPRPGTRRVFSANTLEGDRVRNPAGDDLGKIEEIMIDLDTGQIAYVVVSFGGFIGIGDKLFAVPWSAFAIDTREHEFILDVDRSALEKAPGFDKNNWPDMADDDFAMAIYTHYGQKPSWIKDFTPAGDYEGDDRIDKADRDRA